MNTFTFDDGAFGHLLTLRQARERAGIARTTVYRRIKEGTFPASVRPGSQCSLTFQRPDSLDGSSTDWHFARSSEAFKKEVSPLPGDNAPCCKMLGAAITRFDPVSRRMGQHHIDHWSVRRSSFIHDRQAGRPEAVQG
ncbi:helix-turn-helix transcriptional regulator [Komagataeibacter diospyri]